jgi:predicted DNA-binding transcriptional regulator YafY
VADTILRQWVILTLLPKQPRVLSTREIHSRLIVDGYDVSARTIERDLVSLSNLFPIGREEKSKPYGWYWTRDTLFELPGITPQVALTFYLASRHLEKGFPRTMLSQLKPWFKRAQICLEAVNGPVTRWAEKIHIANKGLELLPPVLDETVMEVVYAALFSERQFEGMYRPRGREPRAYRIHPRGLVLRSGAIYLVATLREYTDIKLLSLNRLESATPTEEPILQLPDFNLAQWVKSGALNIPVSDVPINLTLNCHPDAIRHLQETPLSVDQTITEPDSDGRVCVRATVIDSLDLRWWIRSQGSQVIVLEPQALREEMKRELEAALGWYEMHPQERDSYAQEKIHDKA